MNSCRHFQGLFSDSRPSCAKGRDVRAWARRCNGGSDFGIALRLPCTKKISDETPLFDCPELDRKTDEEIEAERAALRVHMDRFVAGLSAINEMRRKMVAHKLSSAKATCPWCGVKDALQVGCAIGANNHMRAHCTSCGEGFIE